jgi:predicted RecB family nuclease
MTLPPDFQFTQTNLQDYVDCARRFELRYIERLAWPAPEAEPVIEHERHMALGARFHGLAHRAIAGMPVEKLALYAAEEPLQSWWANWLRTGLEELPSQRHPEIMLSAPLGDFRLLAKYDLIAVAPGARAVVFQSTMTARASRNRLAERLQTVVYRYLLAVAGAHLNGDQPILPEQIEMVYWFAEAPDEPERFPYSATQFQEDEHRLHGLVHEISTREVFELTTDETRCRFCTYRSLCNRGEQAGDFRMLALDAEAETATDFVFDLDQIAEIEF